MLDIPQEDSLRAYTTVSVRTLYTSFDWLLSQHRGNGGRKRGRLGILAHDLRYKQLPLHINPRLIHYGYTML
jgi:hypothetical protein